MCNRAILLGISTGYIKGQALALRHLAWIEFLSGEHSKAQLYAQQSERLARAAEDLYGEAGAARQEALFWKEVGHYKQSLWLCIQARDLLALCGISASEANLAIMNTQAEVHTCKSEYSKAQDIYTSMLQNVSVNQNAYWHAVALLNIAGVGLLVGVRKDFSQKDIECAQSIFNTSGLKSWVTACDPLLAALCVRENFDSKADV
ncbi:hypothetical protein DFH08DRAFT_799844 [Mycena albidolilacea]|uniref:Uncharacterized protein n=1 Tax=Mycena albidolilacea TaxID=1033008 RepID=A0AAD7AM52_9AGAR|nr:hypothetical protein DFH08DRAFT_799844 [Mycena albidolilacea]